ncbi:MAG: flagellar biosynthesis protein FliO [Rhodanobacter sp.]|nr:MAG: flagellar biosynthesis protein FliO [Rhodanobacter sp.]
MNTLAFISVAAPAISPQINVGGELARVILSLLGIIVLILAAGWISRRVQRRPGGAGRRIRCVETFAVGARDRLLLLEADGQRLLVGVGQGGMRTLHVYDRAVQPAEDPPEPAPASMTGFGELLARWKRGS